MEPDYFIIRYAEIGLKGGNRRFFENLLMRNIRTALRGQSYESVRLSFSKILLKLKKESDHKQMASILERVFGIENFSPAISCTTDYNDMEKVALAVAAGARAKTFRITANRPWKGFPLPSQELNNRLGKAVAGTGMKVNLTNADLNIEVDVLREKSFIFTERQAGPGGLPAGSAGKVVSLISGGIDSPVASWMMMKRGCSLAFVHFYNENLGAPQKVKELASTLCRNQPPMELYLIPFAECQKAVISGTPADYRMILYRRMMLRISQMIAESEKAKAIVTGDSVGQVASQTVENIQAIDEAVSMPVFRPLVGMDKRDIVRMAERIGTYQISIKPYQDCCSFMVPKHPVTKANLEVVKDAEKRMRVKALSSAAVKSAQRLTLDCL